MIGFSKVGKGFYGCLNYNLNDKRELSESLKKKMMHQDGLQHKDRAEILHYNLCFGDTKKLARDCRQVARLSKRVEKPVFHFALRLAPGDTLTNEQWVEVGQKLSHEFNFQDNQYVVILHKDTPEQHIHVVANRVGFDGRVASDSNNFRRTADFCRRMEQEYKLTNVQSPRAFLPKEKQSQERLDQRKIKLKKDIARTLGHHSTYTGFEQGMKVLGYQVIKGRGITFIDDKKVRTKGSEVGFSLATIEKVLGVNTQLFEKVAELEWYERNAPPQPEVPKAMTATQQLIWKVRQEHRYQSSPAYQLRKVIDTLSRMVSELCYNLFKPEYVSQYVDPAFRMKPKRKKKKKRL